MLNNTSEKQMADADKPAEARPVKLQQHPLSAAFSPMPTEAFQGPVDSVGEIGVQNPITLFEGMVVDGWHHYLASIEAGMDCPTVEFGDVDPKDFVIAQNKARRHLSQSQLALATSYVYARRSVGNPAFVQSGSECPIAKTNAELAEISGASEHTIKQSKSFQHHAAPEVLEAVKRGEVGLPKAAAIAKLPLDEQAAPVAPTTASMLFQSIQVMLEMEGRTAALEKQQLVISARMREVVENNALKVCPQSAEPIFHIRKHIGKAFGLSTKVIDEVMRQLSYSPETAGMVLNDNEAAQCSHYAVFWVKDVITIFTRFVAECQRETTAYVSHPFIEARFKLAAGAEGVTA